MGLDLSFIGRTYPPTEPYEVGREKIREFADAIGDPNPAYRDRAAAEKLGHPDVIAPPTFPIVLSVPASMQVVGDPALGLDYSRVVHGEQRFVYTRPIRPGDRLVVLVSVANIRSAAGNDLITIKGDVATVEGEPVVTSYSTLVSRGTAEV
ncbi:MAG TPA: MaoC family dehydratase N-terminal domain-containing protein [Mycobacteriales bacterium]|nr:MaoC family dehydratase N-terminal domain-containing protein [Mycobacteriales bacterium]